MTTANAMQRYYAEKTRPCIGLASNRAMYLIAFLTTMCVGGWSMAALVGLRVIPLVQLTVTQAPVSDRLSLVDTILSLAASDFNMTESDLVLARRSENTTNIVIAALHKVVTEQRQKDCECQSEVTGKLKSNVMPTVDDTNTCYLNTDGTLMCVVSSYCDEADVEFDNVAPDYKVRPCPEDATNDDATNDDATNDDATNDDATGTNTMGTNTMGTNTMGTNATGTNTTGTNTTGTNATGTTTPATKKAVIALGTTTTTTAPSRRLRGSQ